MPPEPFIRSSPNWSKLDWRLTRSRKTSDGICKIKPMPKKHIRISHRTSGTTLAEGPVGWGSTPFEGNYYISRKFLRTRDFKPNYIPGLCFYKFLYVWLDLHLEEGHKIRNLGWLYWLPNPLFPFIWYRVGVPQHHPGLIVEEIQAPI